MALESGPGGLPEDSRAEADAGLDTIYVDFRYVAVDHEIWALGEMLKVVESSIDRLARRYETVRLDELRAAGWEGDEAEQSFASQDIHEIREYVLPRLVRGPFLSALWGTFEVGISVIAQERSVEIDAALRLSDLRGSILDKSRKFFPAVLGIPFDQDVARLKRLKSLYAVRNAFAHGNGRREAIPVDLWKEIESSLGSDMFDPSNEFLVLSHSYLRSAYDDVAGSLRTMLTAARAREG